LDTRTKIIPFSESAAQTLATVQMDCDPLLASVLAKLQGPLYVFVADRADSYLTTQARAELAASLGSVRYVSIGEHPGALDLRPEEAVARQALEQLVLRKSEV
jgi:hypothetical protein